MEVSEEVKGLVEEEVFREYLRVRVRAKDVAQVALVGSKGTTKAPANDKGNVVEGGAIEGGLVIIGSTELAPKN